MSVNYGAGLLPYALATDTVVALKTLHRMTLHYMLHLMSEYSRHLFRTVHLLQEPAEHDNMSTWRRHGIHLPAANHAYIKSIGRSWHCCFKPLDNCTYHR